MSRFEKRNLYAVLYLLLGLAGFGLYRLMYATAQDASELLLPLSMQEIGLLVLTACVCIAAFLLVRGSALKEGSAVTNILGDLVFAAGIYTLLTTEAVGPKALVMVYRVFSYAAIAALVLSAVMRLLGKKPFFLLTFVPCVLCVLQLVVCYQLWSEVPQLMDYFFGLGAVLTLTLSAYYRLARAAGMKDKTYYYAVSLTAVFFGITAAAQKDYSLFCAAGAAWVAADLLALGKAAEE